MAARKDKISLNSVGAKRTGRSPNAERNAGFGALLLMEFDREFYPTCAPPASWRSCAASCGPSSGNCAAFISLMFGEWRSALGAAISFSAKLDKSYPRGIHIGEGTAINFGACILTHDTPRGVHADTWIGKECNIGANSIIMAGDPGWRQLRGRGGERGDEGRAVELPGRGEPGADHGKGHQDRPHWALSTARSARTSEQAPSAPDEAAPEKAAS